jgi:hypothetical protein
VSNAALRKATAAWLADWERVSTVTAGMEIEVYPDPGILSGPSPNAGAAVRSNAVTTALSATATRSAVPRALGRAVRMPGPVCTRPSSRSIGSSGRET